MIQIFEGKIPKIAVSAYISETCHIIGDVEIGENSGIFPGAVIRGDFARIKIGSNTMIEDNCVLHSANGTVIGDNVIIGHGVVVHGSKIGDNCLIGSNATLLDDSKIGKFCVIGAGCLVTKNMEIPDYSMVVGVPGVVTGQISAEMKEHLREGSQAYKELVKRYKRQPEK